MYKWRTSVCSSDRSCKQWWPQTVVRSFFHKTLKNWLSSVPRGAHSLKEKWWNATVTTLLLACLCCTVQFLDFTVSPKYDAAGKTNKNHVLYIRNIYLRSFAAHGMFYSIDIFIPCDKILTEKKNTTTWFPLCGSLYTKNTFLHIKDVTAAVIEYTV